MVLDYVTSTQIYSRNDKMNFEPIPEMNPALFNVLWGSAISLSASVLVFLGYTAHVDNKKMKKFANPFMKSIEKQARDSYYNHDSCPWNKHNSSTAHVKKIKAYHLLLGVRDHFGFESWGWGDSDRRIAKRRGLYNGFSEDLHTAKSGLEADLARYVRDEVVVSFDGDVNWWGDELIDHSPTYKLTLNISKNPHSDEYYRYMNMTSKEIREIFRKFYSLCRTTYHPDENPKY